MSLELVGPDDVYELEYRDGVVFKMRHWLRGMQEEVDRRCVVVSGKDVRYDVSLDREIKIENCLVDWSGITQNGAPVPCTPENKKKLPVGVFLWLVQQIEERAGIRMAETEKKT